MTLQVTKQELGILVVLYRAGVPLARKTISVELGYGLEQGNNMRCGLKRLCDLGVIKREGETTKKLRFSLVDNRFPAVELHEVHPGRPQKQKLSVEHLFSKALTGQL